MLEVSEPQLYLYAQAGVTLYADILVTVFQQHLKDHIPERVLPVCTTLPKSLPALVKAEFDDIKDMVKPNSRKGLQARAKIRSLAVVEASLQGVRSQPGESELNRLLGQVRKGQDWRSLFPGVATLQLDTESPDGIPVAIRITKREGEPVQLVPAGTPGGTVVSVKRVNELDYFSLGLKNLAEKTGLSQARALALVRHLDLQSSSEHFKEVRLSKVLFKRYSAKALDAIQKALKTVDMVKVWAEHKPTRRGHRK